MKNTKQTVFPSLTEEQLSPILPTCPLCKGTDRHAVAILQETPQVTLVECRSCLASSTSRLPTSQTLDHFYRETFYKLTTKISPSGKRITFSDPDRFGRHILKSAGKHLKKNHISILDFGGGDGSLALAIAKDLLKGSAASISIEVVDIIKPEVTAIDERISLQWQEKMEHTAERFDLVIASASLEHVPNPKECLDMLLHKTLPGGIFYARTPYVSPLLKIAEAARLNWDFFFPAHLHDMGQSFWEKEISALQDTLPLKTLRSAPSLVQTSWKQQPFVSLAAYLLKAPWHIFRHRYKLVGGWEIMLLRL